MESANNSTAPAAEAEDIASNGVQYEDGCGESPEDCKVFNQDDAKDNVICEVSQLPQSVSQVVLTLEELSLEPKENVAEGVSEEAACSSPLPTAASTLPTSAASSSMDAALLPSTQKPTSSTDAALLPSTQKPTSSTDAALLPSTQKPTSSTDAALLPSTQKPTSPTDAALLPSTQKPTSSTDAALLPSTQKPTSSTDAALLSTQKPTSKPQKQSSTNFVHRLKWITWRDNKTPIVTQNENGPCPLIAIANVLLLSRRIQLASNMEEITADQLIEYIGDTIFENIPKNLSGTKRLDYEQNMNDAMAVLPRLQTGLDVNIKFTGVQDFEYTAECIIFDLLNIPLYHGWLVDPQAHDTVSALGNLGYNQLVEKIIANKCSREVELSTEALIAEEFLEKTASQLTVHGLCELNAAMRKNELAVLFRNNHFITILKKGDHLYQLVTDQGFLHESRVVWETLSNIEGDEAFVDANFLKVPPKSPGSYTDLPTKISQDQQINHDYLLALSLQEDQKQLDQEQAWEFKGDITADEELARRIQEDEQKHLGSSVAASSEVPPNQIHPDVHLPNPAAQPINEERNKKGSCIIL